MAYTAWPRKNSSRFAVRICPLFLFEINSGTRILLLMYPE
jgi:hypothetical protein